MRKARTEIERHLVRAVPQHSLRQHLPDDPAALRQIVIGLLEELDAKERRLSRVQHLLEQLLRHRYGPKRERVDENQLFLFAAEIVAGSIAGLAIGALLFDRSPGLPFSVNGVIVGSCPGPHPTSVPVLRLVSGTSV